MYIKLLCFIYMGIFYSLLFLSPFARMGVDGSPHGGEGFHIHAVFQRQRCEGMSQIMESDTLAVCPLQYRLKPPSCHAGRDRSIRLHRGRKHPAGIHLPAVFPQHGQHRRRQHQLSDGCLGFGRDDLQFAIYRVRLLVDGQHAGFKVQIPPLKRYQFTPPQAGAEIQQEQFVVPVRLRLNEKFLQFLPIQHLHFLCLFRRQLAADGGVCTEQVIPHGPFQGGAADRVAHPHHAVGKARAVLLRQTLAAVLFQPPVELLQIILRQFVQWDFSDLRQDMVVDDIFVVVLRGGAKRRLAVGFIPVAQPVPEQHIRFDLSVISPHHAFGELTQLLLTFPLCFGEDILRLGKAIVIIADDNAALPPAVAALSYGAGSAFPFLCQGLSPFPSRSSMKPPTMPLAAFCISGVTWV